MLTGQEWALVVLIVGGLSFPFVYVLWWMRAPP